MEGGEDIIRVECACGEIHEFGAQYTGRLARCPKLNRRFRVPSSSGSVAFIVDPQPESATPDEEQNTEASSRRTGGWLVKRVTRLYHDHKQKRELYSQTHCRCRHCKAENLTADFMCAKCGCPLHDEHAAFLFMEKRRQEAHELKVAQGESARQLATPPPSAREAHPAPYAPPRIEQKVIVRQGSGCLTIIGAIVVIIFILVMIPICSAPFLVSSNKLETRTNQEVVGSASPSRSQRPQTARDGGGVGGAPPVAPAANPTKKPAEPEWASAKSAVRQGDVELRITRVLVGKVPLRAGFDDRETTSQDELLAIHVELTNRSQSKKVEYRSWLGRDVSFTRDYATLKDNFGNGYKRISFGFGTDIIGHTESESIYPGKALDDALIFEMPVDSAEYLELELPAKNFGGDGVLRLRIPEDMIHHR